MINGKIRFFLIKKIELATYKDFFKLVLHDILSKCVEQNVMILEVRHTVGQLFDDFRSPISLEEELRII